MVQGPGHLWTRAVDIEPEPWTRPPPGPRHMQLQARVRNMPAGASPLHEARRRTRSLGIEAAAGPEASPGQRAARVQGYGIDRQSRHVNRRAGICIYFVSDPDIDRSTQAGRIRTLRSVGGARLGSGGKLRLRRKAQAGRWYMLGLRRGTGAAAGATGPWGLRGGSFSGPAILCGAARDMAETFPAAMQGTGLRGELGVTLKSR